MCREIMRLIISTVCTIHKNKNVLVSSGTPEGLECGTYNNSSRMNSEVFWSYPRQKRFCSGLFKHLGWMQWFAFNFLKAKHPKHKQDVKDEAVKTWWSITREETQHLSMGSSQRICNFIKNIQSLHCDSNTVICS